MACGCRRGPAARIRLHSEARAWRAAGAVRRARAQTWEKNMQADPKTVLNLLKTARGQLDGVVRMVEDDRYCIDISNQLMAIESLVAKANATVLKAHVAGCVRTACCCGDEAERDVKLAEIEGVIDKLSR